MLEQLWQLAIDDGGIWCCLCVYMIINNNKKNKELESWVREEVVTAINASTAAMTQIKEIVDNANKHDS